MKTTTLAPTRVLCICPWGQFTFDHPAFKKPVITGTEVKWKGAFSCPSAVIAAIEHTVPLGADREATLHVFRESLRPKEPGQPNVKIHKMPPRAEMPDEDERKRACNYASQIQLLYQELPPRPEEPKKKKKTVLVTRVEGDEIGSLEMPGDFFPSLLGVEQEAGCEPKQPMQITRMGCNYWQVQTTSGGPPVYFQKTSDYEAKKRRQMRAKREKEEKDPGEAKTKKPPRPSKKPRKGE